MTFSDWDDIEGTVQIDDEYYLSPSRVVVFIIDEESVHNASEYIKSKFDGKEFVECDGCVYTGVDEYHRPDSLIIFCREKKVSREYHGDLMFVFIYDCIEINVITKAAVDIYREYRHEIVDKYLGK